MRKGSIQNVEEQKNFKHNNKITNKNIIIMLIWFVITFFMIIQVIQLIKYTLGVVQKEDALLYNVVNNIIVNVFPNGNGQIEEEYKLDLAALGDIYVTQNILNGFKVSNGYDFISGTEKVEKKLKEYDVIISALSTPVSGSEYGYTKSEVYNSPNEIIDMLSKLNVSAVATASYHSLDKGAEGAKKTIENLKENNISQVGLNESKEEGKPVVISKNNITIGILSYATTSNVKMGTNDEYVLDILNEEDLAKDMEYLKSKDVDYIIAYLNVKNENQELTSSSQKQNTEILFNAGVNVVLGTGSRVVQEETEDIITVNNKKQQIYGIYCMGDFIGAYENNKNQENVIANIEFTKKVIKDKKGNIIEEIKDMLVKDLINVSIKVSSNYSSTFEIVELEE